MAAPSRRRRSRVPRRYLALALVLLIAFLYWRPVSHYLETKDALRRMRADVGSLRAQRASLRRRLAATRSTPALAREARQLGFVAPGEHLYVVGGIPRWLRSHRATLGGDGR